MHEVSRPMRHVINGHFDQLNLIKVITLTPLAYHGDSMGRAHLRISHTPCTIMLLVPPSDRQVEHMVHLWFFTVSSDESHRSANKQMRVEDASNHPHLERYEGLIFHPIDENFQ